MLGKFLRHCYEALLDQIISFQRKFSRILFVPLKHQKLWKYLLLNFILRWTNNRTQNNSLFLDYNIEFLLAWCLISARCTRKLVLPYKLPIPRFSRVSLCSPILRCEIIETLQTEKQLDNNAPKGLAFLIKKILRNRQYRWHFLPSNSTCNCFQLQILSWICFFHLLLVLLKIFFLLLQKSIISHKTKPVQQNTEWNLKSIK